MLLESRNRSLGWRTVAAILYAAAALATVNWLDYGLWGPQPYGGQNLMPVVFAGSVMLGLACVFALLGSSYGGGSVPRFLGLKGGSWPQPLQPRRHKQYLFPAIYSPTGESGVRRGQSLAAPKGLVAHGSPCPV